MSTWPDDDDLLRDLGDAVRAESVPDRMRTAAQAAFAWRTVDAELLSLEHDSATSDTVLVRDAALTGRRLVSFRGGDLTLEVELDAAGGLLGVVVPGRRCRVVLVQFDGHRRVVEVDESGSFSFEGIAGGPLRFQVEVEGPTHTTGWLVP